MSAPSVVVCPLLASFPLNVSWVCGSFPKNHFFNCIHEVEQQTQNLNNKFR